METLRGCFDTQDWAMCLATEAGIPPWLFAIIGIACIALVLRLVVGKRSKADDNIGPFDMT